MMGTVLHPAFRRGGGGGVGVSAEDAAQDQVRNSKNSV